MIFRLLFFSDSTPAAAGDAVSVKEEFLDLLHARVNGALLVLLACGLLQGWESPGGWGLLFEVSRTLWRVALWRILACMSGSCLLQSQKMQLYHYNLEVLVIES